MKTRNDKQHGNAILRFGLNRTIQKNSTLVLLLVISAFLGINLIAVVASFFGDVFGNNDVTADTFGLIGFIVFSSVEFLLLGILTLVNASGEIAGERSRQTFDMLICTQMSPFEIIFGKLASTMSMTLLAACILLPFYAILFFFGGFTPLSLIIIFLTMLMNLISIGAISIWTSSMVNKPQTATLLSVLFVAIVYVGTGILGVIWLWFQEIINAANGYNIAFSYNYPPILYLNPVAAFIMLFGVTLEGFRGFLSDTGLYGYEVVLPIVCNVLICGVLTVFPFMGAVRNINPMKGKKR